MFKKSLIAALTAVLLSALAACGTSQLSVPNLKGVDGELALTLLADRMLIPKTSYDYSNDVLTGQVVRTEPKSGSAVVADQVVTVFVSRGPASLSAEDSSISWSSIGYGSDDWEFTSPSIEKGVLVIECEPKFAASMEWRDPQSENQGFGRASISDTFEKTVPVTIQFEKKKAAADERQKVTLRIPLSDLDVQRPTTMFLKLYAKQGGDNINIEIDFSITWPSA